MARYFIMLSYDGQDFHGWQIQPNGNSVQAELMHALSMLLRIETPVIGAGRTDAGVHAKYMVAHFDAELGNITPQRLVMRLNALLPRTIGIQKLTKVKNDAHARFDAVSRRYEYHVHLRKNPFLRNYSCRIPEDTNFEVMNNAAEKLLLYSDFTSFSKLHTDTKTNLCKITMAEWRQLSDNEWMFVIESDRFLRNMVRAVVGTLLDVGKGKLSVDDFCRIIELKNRSIAGTSAPAQGLFLVHVNYPNNIFV